jgi:hypothetical protein
MRILLVTDAWKPQVNGVVTTLVELQQGLGLEQIEPRDRQLAAQVEQLVLHVHEQFAHRGGQRLAQQQPQVRVEFVDLPDGGDAQAVLADAGVVTQPGAAVVARARGDLREALAHVSFPWMQRRGFCRFQM